MGESTQVLSRRMAQGRRKNRLDCKVYLKKGKRESKINMLQLWQN
jgi:hypothetical protein